VHLVVSFILWFWAVVMLHEYGTEPGCGDSLVGLIPIFFRLLGIFSLGETVNGA